MNKLYALLSTVTLAACAATAFPSLQDGLLTYAGSQKTIFDAGKAEGKVPVDLMACGFRHFPSDGTKFC